MAHVLSDFSKSEFDWVGALLKACGESADLLAAGDDEKYQTKVMHLAPAPKADPRKPAAED